MQGVKVKICCISSVDESRLAIQYGAAAIGLVGKMPSGPGVIEDDLIYTIAKTIPPPISTFLLTSETNANKIIDLGGTLHTNELDVRKQSLINSNSLFNSMDDMKNNMTNIKNFNTTMDNILRDSDVTLLYENYNYLFWSILAAGTVLISVNVANKS
jgi:phosphoribosylanthranilate isomerase